MQKDAKRSDIIPHRMSPAENAKYPNIQFMTKQAIDIFLLAKNSMNPSLVVI